MPKCGKLCNVSPIVENAYKVFVFENILEKSVCVRNVFVCAQATTSHLPTQKVVCIIFLFL